MARPARLFAAQVAQRCLVRTVTIPSKESILKTLLGQIVNDTAGEIHQATVKFLAL